jgi:hypothetical protein
MDENFLLHRRRALRLLELMKQHDKAWSLYVFSSANVLRGYSEEQLLGLGISWVWMGLEGENSRYLKLRKTDTRQAVSWLQSHGICVLGSTIIGLEDHTPQNIDAVIDYAVRHDTDFHQFMLYTPVAGTPLFDDLLAQGRMKDESEYHPGDIHGQLIFNYRHPHIPDGQEAEYIIRAFQRDFQANGPSLLRIARTVLQGWKRHGSHPEARLRRRFQREARSLVTRYAPVLWAMKRHYRQQPAMRQKIHTVLQTVYHEFGLPARLTAQVGGPYVLWKLRREQRRLAAGWTYEPPTFYELNEAAAGSHSAAFNRHRRQLQA